MPLTKDREAELRKMIEEELNRYQRNASWAQHLLDVTECEGGHECQEDHEEAECDCDLSCDLSCDPATAHPRGAGYAALAQAHATMANTWMQLLAHEGRN